MKVVHLSRNFSSHKTGQELFEMAREMETADEKAEAIALYEAMIKKDFQKEAGYNRIMILLRSLKEPEKELLIIDEAVAEFKVLYSKRRVIHSKETLRTSKKLAKSLGLDNELQAFPEPIPRWLKRKSILVKRINARKRKKI